MESEKERPTLQCCAKSQSARYWLDIISGDIFKILWIYCHSSGRGAGDPSETLRRRPFGRDQVSGANNSGPDGTDDGGCERDWGFETHSRRTFTRLSTLGHDNSASGDALGDTSRWTPPTTTATVRWQVGRAFSFSHYTTEGIFIHGDPAFRPPLEPSRPRAATSETRDHALEWEFSLTIPGNAFITA